MLTYLLGYRPLDFTNDRGELVKGTQAFVASQEDGVIGQRADKLFFKDGMELPDLTPGIPTEWPVTPRSTLFPTYACPSNTRTYNTIPRRPLLPCSEESTK